MSKANSADAVRQLTDIPNIGVSLAADLCSVGITSPDQVRDMDPLDAYERLRSPMGQRHDPCVLDTFMAAHAFMNGGERLPWWHFTAQRKALLAPLNRL